LRRRDVPRVDDVSGLEIGLAAHVDDRRTAVRQPDGIVRTDAGAPPGAMPHLDYDRKNGQNRGGDDQERMICGVLDEAIHWVRSYRWHAERRWRIALTRGGLDR